MRLQQHTHVQAAARGILQGMDDAAGAHEIDLDPDRALRRLDSPHDRGGSGVRLDEDADASRSASDREARPRAGGGWWADDGGVAGVAGVARGEQQGEEEKAAEEIRGTVRPVS